MSDEELRRLTEGGKLTNSWASWPDWKLKEEEVDQESCDYDDYPEYDYNQCQANSASGSGSSDSASGKVEKKKLIVDESKGLCELAPHSAMNAGAGRVSDPPSPQDIRLLHEFVEDIEKHDEHCKPREERFQLAVLSFGGMEHIKINIGSLSAGGGFSS
ncbi:hypothetical protein KQX54_019548 [Cotesia glomerata]|uniref:Uncharacterized protein n=1 Tax=Cotesia glomerata TaxID=32391 RepID=A0AAV7IB92_COTGL|nr:hypothetical protein KQX54_019548 [Cotesia glomerata]